MSDEDRIPVVESYRGIDIHAFQTSARIAVVKGAVDRVYGMSVATELSDYVLDHLQPPEARLFAAARCEAIWQMAAERRENRPPIDMELVRVHIVGLNSLKRIDRWHYGTMLHVRPPGRRDEATKRETPLTDEQIGRSRAARG